MKNSLDGTFGSGIPLPVFIMFSFDAKSEENYQVRANWVVGLPKVKDFFRH
jgi:hypothetical protein